MPYWQGLKLSSFCYLYSPVQFHLQGTNMPHFPYIGPFFVHACFSPPTPTRFAWLTPSHSGKHSPRPHFYQSWMPPPRHTLNCPRLSCPRLSCHTTWDCPLWHRFSFPSQRVTRFGTRIIYPCLLPCNLQGFMEGCPRCPTGGRCGHLTCYCQWEGLSWTLCLMGVPGDMGCLHQPTGTAYPKERLFLQPGSQHEMTWEQGHMEWKKKSCGDCKPPEIWGVSLQGNPVKADCSV